MKTDNLTIAASVYDQMDVESRLFLLSCLVSQMSIRTRGCYSGSPQVVNSSGDSPIGYLNEVQHQLGNLLTDELLQLPDRSKGNSFVTRIIEWAPDEVARERLLDDIIYCIQKTVNFQTGIVHFSSPLDDSGD